MQVATTKPSEKLPRPVLLAVARAKLRNEVTSKGTAQTRLPQHFATFQAGQHLEEYLISSAECFAS